MKDCLFCVQAEFVYSVCIYAPDACCLCSELQSFVPHVHNGKPASVAVSCCIIRYRTPHDVSDPPCGIIPEPDRSEP